jgi:glycosyltransferase involved in cell wall biosynthesis
MPKNKDLALVIPCHNEAATLGPVVAGAARFGQVFVVDDRSTDASAAVAAANGATVLPSAAPGYDGALVTGLRHAHAAGFARVATLDADGEHDPACLAGFVAALDAGAAVACGVRARPQRAAEHLAALLARPLYGLRDPLCGMKGYAGEALALFFASGAPLLVNMAPAVLAAKAGLPVTNVPVTGAVRADAPRFGRALRANLAILQAILQAARLTLPAR